MLLDEAFDACMMRVTALTLTEAKTMGGKHRELQDEGYFHSIHIYNYNILCTENYVLN